MRSRVAPEVVLGLFHEGVDAFCSEAARLDETGWARTACGHWSATQLARHVLAVIGWYHDWLDRAEAGDGSPAFDVADLEARNERDQAAMAGHDGPTATELFRERAALYAARLPPTWDLPFGYPRGTVTPGLHAGLAAFEWHAHTWDLARSHDRDHQPSRPAELWQAGADCLATTGVIDPDQPPPADPWRAMLAVRPMRIEAVVFDLDGVIRHWDIDVNAAIEDRHGLARGAIIDAAFDPELGPAAVTGALDYETWALRIGERLDCPAAVEEWGRFRGNVDAEAVALVDAVRAGGCRVALLSNATTRLEEDLAVLGLDGTFDVVFNTARLGVAKPDHDVYRRVVEALAVPADRIVFTDDTPSWADAACEVGLHGIPFTGVTHLRERLQELGVRT